MEMSYFLIEFESEQEHPDFFNNLVQEIQNYHNKRILTGLCYTWYRNVYHNTIISLKADKEFVTLLTLKYSFRQVVETETMIRVSLPDNMLHYRGPSN
jgi:hypothetical protein